MNSHIHIHDIYYYGIAVTLTCSIGCSNIASHLHSRWLFHKTQNVIRIQWLIKIVIIMLGMIFINIFTLFHFDELMLFTVPMAILSAIFAVKMELLINRIQLFQPGKQKLPSSHMITVNQIIQNETQGIASRVMLKKVQLMNVHERHAGYSGQLMQCTVNDIMLVAICEEFIYRGFMWKIALLLPYYSMTIIAALVSVLLFGASHLTMGRGQFVSKTILGIFCFLPVIVTQNIIPAIIVHVTFNLIAYQKNVNS